MSSLDRPRVAWVLNLDAEEELAARHRYEPTRHLHEIIAREGARLAGSLVEPGDIVVDECTPVGAATGFEGRAWSPTPRARRLLERAGASVAEAPGMEVLRRVNARPFASDVRTTLLSPAFEKHVASDLEPVLALLARPADAGWLVRRTFGAAGRGRRRMASGKPTDPERAWLVASLRKGPLVIEPWVEVTREFTRSGFVERTGRVRIAGPCFQRTTREGAWIATKRSGAGEVQSTDDHELERATQSAGEALARAGYFGPFGIDAFRYRAGARQLLNPMSEINARYTMDWTLAMTPEVIALG